MSTAGGPNTLGESNLVFAYDIGDVKNSYIGEPTTNQYTNPDFTNGTTGWAFGSWDGNVTYTTEAVTGPFGKTINALKLTKNATSAHSHFHQYNSGKYTTGNQYTLSAWVKGTGTFRGNTQWGGIVQSFTLTGDWQYVQYTVTAPNNNNFPYWAAEALTTGTVFYMVYAQSEQKSHATPFVNGTRSATQGLLPLVGNSILDLSNVSFNSKSQIIFDGTNDDLRVQVSNSKTNITMEGVFYVNLGTTGTYLNNGNDWGGYCIGIGSFFYTQDNQITALFGYVRWILTGAYYEYTGYHHIVMTLDETSTPSIYVNGKLIGTYPGNPPNNVTPGTGFSIGSQWGIRYSNTICPVSKFYNRVLSANEIKQNYQQYKTRFNLS